MIAALRGSVNLWTRAIAECHDSAAARSCHCVCRLRPVTGSVHQRPFVVAAVRCRKVPILWSIGRRDPTSTASCAALSRPNFRCRRRTKHETIPPPGAAKALGLDTRSRSAHVPARRSNSSLVAAPYFAAYRPITGSISRQRSTSIAFERSGHQRIFAGNDSLRMTQYRPFATVNCRAARNSFHGQYLVGG